MRRWVVPMAFVTSGWAVIMVHASVCPSSEATGMTDLQYIGICVGVFIAGASFSIFLRWAVPATRKYLKTFSEAMRRAAGGK